MTPDAEATFGRAYEIAKEYNGNLTVRQLYYRIVAEDAFPDDRRWTKVPNTGRWILDLENGSKNADPNYKWLIGLLTDARFSGAFPFDWLLDRTREARPGKFTKTQTDVAAALENAANDLRGAPESWLWQDRWYGQPQHVSVWVEKEALMGVFEEPCEQLGVAWFVLRGYSSLSAISQWIDNVREAYDAGHIESATVLYFGDHDPDGWEIPRSAERNVQDIARVREIDLPPIEFERVALLGEQIRKFKPPPFPAKESSSRYDSYVKEHGLTDAWELDALRPEVLERLIRDGIAAHFDESVHAANTALVKRRRDEMRKKMKVRGWLQAALDGGK